MAPSVESRNSIFRFLTYFGSHFLGSEKNFATFFEEYIYKNNKGVFNFSKSQFLHIGKFMCIYRKFQNQEKLGQNQENIKNIYQ